MRAKRDDNFYTMLKSLVIPITVQSFMLALVSATDAAMLGLLDQTALSSVSRWRSTGENRTFLQSRM